MKATSHRKYDKEFKENAVQLYKASQRSAKQLSEELGVPESTLSGWIETNRRHGEEAFPGKGHLRSREAEFAKLRRELAITREERDILKKVVGIFSSPKSKNMNS